MDQPFEPTLPALEDDVRAWLRQQPTLPNPGSGHTLERWRGLAAVAAQDLCMAKVVEAHHDARAILAELDAPMPEDGQLGAVWAAEGPQSTLRFDSVLRKATGEKPWCSGADLVDFALVTAKVGDEQCLLLVRTGATGFLPLPGAWHATGMARIPSGNVHFDGVTALRVGSGEDYLQRPGFWHGGAGIAACWYGAAAALAAPLQEHPKVKDDPHLAALLGQVDMQLQASAALLRALAADIDAAPGDPHQTAVVRVRSVVERTCTHVLDLVGRALGPAPMCLHAEHARRWSDLAVFIRQSHADRDWAALGRAVAPQDQPWRL